MVKPIPVESPILKSGVRTNYVELRSEPYIGCGIQYYISQLYYLQLSTSTHDHSLVLVLLICPTMVPFLNSNKNGKSTILYHSRDRVHVGELYRYYITYTSSSPASASEHSGPDISASNSTASTPKSLWLKIKNLESVALRAAYLAGPYMLYADVRSEDYSHLEKVYQDSELPFYNPQIKAGQSVYVELSLAKKKWKHVWIVDVVSQIIFSTNSEVQFDISVATDRDSLRGSNGPQYKTIVPNPNIVVRKLDTLDIWHTPVPRIDKPVHLVVITHGLHSNVGADMLYVKEQIDSLCSKTGENVIVRGYFDNVCKTEKGIAFLGRRLGDYVLNTLASGSEDKVVPTKISFIAHSLGGLIQTFAIAHIQSKDKKFFDRIEPCNFVALATPFLGISNENPGYVKFALDVGFVGKTGRDLGLTWNINKKLRHKKPLLQVLPGGYAHDALVKFKNRTLYANAINDGIVPLRTASILYLDWRGIAKAGIKMKNAPTAASSSDSGRKSIDSTTEVPNTTDTISDSTPQKSGSAFPSILSFVAPQAGYKKKSKILRRTQTMSQQNDSSDNEGDNDEDVESKILNHMPKTTSMLESGLSVLVPPLPSSSFISDPSSRENIILHDKVYKEEDLPPRRFKAKSSLFNLSKKPNSDNSSSSSASTTSTSQSHGNNIDEQDDDSPLESPISEKKTKDQVEQSKLEERIAREWHRGLDWRKVLVKLEPDAHNNIIVRRRFANAYGWPVIDHMVRSHFLDSRATQEQLGSSGSISAGNRRLNQLRQPPPSDSFDDGMDLSSMTYSLERSELDFSPRPLQKHDTTLSSTSALSFESRGSRHRAWESHLLADNEESDEDGLVVSINTWIDKYRDPVVPAAISSTKEAPPVGANEDLAGID